MKFNYYDIETVFGNLHFKNIVITPQGTKQYYDRRGNDFEVTLEGIEFVFDSCEFIDDTEEQNSTFYSSQEELKTFELEKRFMEKYYLELEREI